MPKLYLHSYHLILYLFKLINNLGNKGTKNCKAGGCNENKPTLSKEELRAIRDKTEKG